MIKILLLHDSEHKNTVYLKKLLEKYPILGQYPDMWKITVVRPGKTIPKIVKKSYDRVYYDEVSLTEARISEYIVSAGSPQIIPCNLQPKPERGAKKKLSTKLVTKVTKLKETKGATKKGKRKTKR